jgi:hypothetical protein
MVEREWPVLAVLDVVMPKLGRPEPLRHSCWKGSPDCWWFFRAAIVKIRQDLQRRAWEGRICRSPAARQRREAGEAGSGPSIDKDYRLDKR